MQRASNSLRPERRTAAADALGQGGVRDGVSLLRER